MAINKAVTKTARVSLKASPRLVRKVAAVQKKLHHASLSETYRHLIEKGIETYAPKKAGKSEKAK